MKDTQVDLFRMATQSQATVLILGATGTGKTTLAKKIHQTSPRKLGPFITVNLAALHEGTLESELFGHERGAFTGAANKRIGKLELAHKGTLFLDEIGELSLGLQARLLEFLHSKKITPVGSNRELELDVRVIAATHRDLNKEALQGTFRADLLHRIRVITFHLKSLFERREEFDQILHGILEEICANAQRNVLSISEEVATFLENYDWPGNLRELRNVVEYMVIASDGDAIHPSHLPGWFLDALEKKHRADVTPDLGIAKVPLSLNYEKCIEAFEREYLKRALSRFRGRVGHTAKTLQMSKTTLLRRIRAYGLLQPEP